MSASDGGGGATPVSRLSPCEPDEDIVGACVGHQFPDVKAVHVVPDEQLSVFGASGDVDGLLPEQLTKKFAPGQRREKVRKEVGGGRVVNDLSGSGPRQDEEGIQWIGWNNSIDFRSSPFLARNVCCWVGKPLGTIGGS